MKVYTCILIWCISNSAGTVPPSSMDEVSKKGKK